MTKLTDKVFALQRRIADERYYFALWLQALDLHPPIAKASDAELTALCNDFWLLLPDSPDIRRGPFFELCDLCTEEEIGDADETD